MHATIVNTLYAKKTKDRNKSTHAKRHFNTEKLNATALLEEFAAYEWAKEVRIGKICICEMGAKKEIVDGIVINEKYHEVASVSIP